MGHPRKLGRFVILLSGSATLLAGCSRAPDERREPAQPDGRIGYGTVMGEVARRFELLGRAAAAGRFELAEYQLGEIAEAFEEALPHAAPPREGHPEVLPGMASAFLQKSIPELRRALAVRDRAQATALFGQTATACNGCHQASGHGFIEIPVTPGHGIPNTDPLAP
jgi:hypothetical protein